MMVCENDPQTQALISHRQKALLAEAEQYRLIQASSPLRVAIGQALIRFGEQVRGYVPAPATDAEPAVPARRLRPAHHAG